MLEYTIHVSVLTLRCDCTRHNTHKLFISFRHVQSLNEAELLVNNFSLYYIILLYHTQDCHTMITWYSVVGHGGVYKNGKSYAMFNMICHKTFEVLFL